MDGESIKLEYELSPKQLLAVQIRTQWPRKLMGVGFCLLFLFLGYGTSPWLIAVILIVFLMIWTSDEALVWAADRLNFQTREPVRIRVETVEDGLRVDNPWNTESTQRYWWSRLREIVEENSGVLLVFDRGLGGLLIPWSAFEDSGQRQRFLESARQHLPAGTSTPNTVKSD